MGVFDGALEGFINGTMLGNETGVMDTADDGLLATMGTIEGTCDELVVGVVVGDIEGLLVGPNDNCSTGIIDGIDDVEGTLDCDTGGLVGDMVEIGERDGIHEGRIEGIEDGADEGKVDGAVDGADEGIIEGL